jgi:hypothetical protein
VPVPAQFDFPCNLLQRMGQAWLGAALREGLSFLCLLFFDVLIKGTHLRYLLIWIKPLIGILKKTKCLSKNATLVLKPLLRLSRGRHLLAVVTGKGRFSLQRQFVVSIHQYAYVVPFVEDETKVFLKTIIPSRKMTRLYLSGGTSYEE